MIRVKIIGTGAYLPKRQVSNDEIARFVPETSDEWILSHTGISSRHLADESESPSDMAIAASREALRGAGVAPEELGLILLSTTTPDYAPIPPTSSLVHRALGAVNAATFDLSAACCGFIYNLELASGLMQNPHRQAPILVVATEMMSRRVDWTDRKTCVLFGDGAAAVVLAPSDSESGIIDTFMKTDSRGADLLVLEGGTRAGGPLGDAFSPFLQMDGSAVFKFAVKIIPEIIANLLERNGLTMDDIDWMIPHQANARMIRSVAARLGVPREKFSMNIDRVANTASASIPIALDEMNRAGLLKPGDKIMTVAFGAGLTYGGNIIVW